MSQPEIPLFDGRQGGTLAMMEAEPARLADLMTVAKNHYGGLGLKIGDILSKRWLLRNASPYKTETAEVARKLGIPGGYGLNASYEWACTSRVEEDPAGGMRILRTLDWQLEGLGRNVCILTRHGQAGPYHDVTWPGAVGVTSAMAPGRFAAMINQPPLRAHSKSYALSWVIEHRRFWASSALSPLHLLRHIFDTCHSYEEAKRRLCDTEICMPAFFTLAGTKPGQGCVIERTATEAYIFEGRACVTNHWRGLSEKGHARGYKSPERLAQIEACQADDPTRLDWVRPPILNPDTRLALVTNPASSQLVVQGFEPDGPATSIFQLPK